MKRFVVGLVGLLLFAAASPVHASGMALRWGSCEGTANRNFACDDNAGAEVLVASFSPPGGVGALSGVAGYGHISSAQGNVPPWWQMYDNGACRSEALGTSFTFFDETQCEDPWNAQGAGGIAAFRSDGQGVDFLIAVAVPAGRVRAASSGQTYVAFKLIITHDQSTGGGSCAGCQTPVCITLERMTLGQANESGYRDVELTQGIAGMGGASNVATWQGGTPNCGAGAPKPSTWSQLKKRWR